MTLPTGLFAALGTLVARPRILLGVDFDGTLAPFVADPMAATPATGAMAAVRAAAALPGVTVALVSGRDLQTLRLLTQVGQDEPIVLIGSHGGQSSLDLPNAPGAKVTPSGIERTEPLAPEDLLDADARGLLSLVSAELEQVAGDHPPVRIEHKPAAVALHTRGVDPAVATPALAAAREVATRHTGVHVLDGKGVVELSVLETSKGTALAALAGATGADATAYVGDDVTDERAFEVLDDAAGDLTVKVGDGHTAASHRVPDVAAVVDLVEQLVALRRQSGP